MGERRRGRESDKEIGGKREKREESGKEGEKLSCIMGGCLYVYMFT